MKFCVRYKDCCVGCSMDFYALRLMGLRGQEIYQIITGQEKEIKNLKVEVEQLKQLVLEQNKTIESLKNESKRNPAHEK